MPEFVEMDNHTYHLQYSDSFSGALLMNVNNHPYVTLEHALNEIFLVLIAFDKGERFLIVTSRPDAK